MKEEIWDNFIKKCEEGYGKKKTAEEKVEIYWKKGTIHKMRGFPKVHKKEVCIRPIVNGKGTVLEKLEELMAKVIKTKGKDYK